MSHLRFSQFFMFLMFVSALSAFVVPPRFTDGGRTQVQGLFAPVSRPVRGIAGVLYGRLSREERTDPDAPAIAPRSDATLLEENESLRVQLTSLQTQLEALKELNADRASLGDIRALCTPMAVTGNDPGSRETLSLNGTTSQGVRVGQAVLHFGGQGGRGLAGKIVRAGITGSQVLLLTDRQSRVSARFGKFQQVQGQTAFVPVAELQPLVEGRGSGVMVVDKITLKQATDAGLAINDWLVLADPEWPANLQGYRLGRIIGIGPKRSAPLFAEIVIDPGARLELLREVMVMNK